MTRALTQTHQTPSRGRPLDVEAVSRITGIAVGTLRNWKCQGRGPRCSKLGKRVVYFERDIEAFIENNVCSD